MNNTALGAKNTKKQEIVFISEDTRRNINMTPEKVKDFVKQRFEHQLNRAVLMIFPFMRR